jgi:hypothetical protein
MVKEENKAVVVVGRSGKKKIIMKINDKCTRKKQNAGVHTAAVIAGTTNSMNHHGRMHDCKASALTSI